MLWVNRDPVILTAYRLVECSPAGVVHQTTDVYRDPAYVFNLIFVFSSVMG